MRNKETDAIVYDTVDDVQTGAGHVSGEDTAATTLPVGPGSDMSLMALDAVIAAAMTGPAGKPFATAAAEIKELAGQAARAADEEAIRLSCFFEGRRAG
jgi:methyl-accepting chemotaxis protein